MNRRLYRAASAAIAGMLAFSAPKSQAQENTKPSFEFVLRQAGACAFIDTNPNSPITGGTAFQTNVTEGNLTYSAGDTVLGIKDLYGKEQEVILHVTGNELKRDFLLGISPEAKAEIMSYVARNPQLLQNVVTELQSKCRSPAPG